MSEDVPETADSAIRGWIVAVGFTLVLIGGELMAEKEGVRFWVGLLLAVAGLPCYLSAYWWKALKPKLDVRFLTTLNGVATDARWWMGGLFIILGTIVFSSPITSEVSRWLRPNPPQLVIAPPPAAPRLPEPVRQPQTAQGQLSVRIVPEPPSPLLGFTDVKTMAMG